MARTGRIVWFNSAKGQGNIASDGNGEMFFFGFSDLETRVFEIEDGQRVEFTDSGQYLSTQKMKKASRVKFI